MENITMTDGEIAMTGAFARVRPECPQSGLHLLADALGSDQGSTLSAPVHVSPIANDVIGLAGWLRQAPIRGKHSVPFTGYAPTTTTFMDVAYIRSGRPPV